MRSLLLLLLMACCAAAQAAMPVAGLEPPVPAKKAPAKAVLPAAKAKAKAGPLLTLPEEVKGDVGDPVRVPAATEGKSVRWVALDPGLKIFPVDMLKDTRTAVVWANKAGRFKLLAYSAVGGEPTDPAVCVVVVGEAPPEPGPGPKPPDPPSNVDAELLAAVRAGYAKDAEADRAELKARLAALYREGARIAQDGKAGGVDVKTWGQWRAAMASAGIGGKLANTQVALAAWLRGKVPNVAAQPLGEEVPAAVAALRMAAAALEATR